MSDWPPLDRANKFEFAKYVTSDAASYFPRNFSRYDLGVRVPDVQFKIAKRIYNSLLEKRILYEWERSSPQASMQSVRSPREIESQGKATCLDLAMLYAGLCLEAELIPILVVLKGHALVAISRNSDLGEFRARRRVDDSYRDAVDMTVLQELLANEDIFLVECTGFAKSDELQRQNSPGFPETTSRDKGLMLFDDAVSTGAAQLTCRELTFAIDVAYLQRLRGYVPLPISNGPPQLKQAELRRLVDLLEAFRLAKTNVRGAYLRADRGADMPDFTRTISCIDHAVRKLSPRDPFAMRAFLTDLTLNDRQRTQVDDWLREQEYFAAAAPVRATPVPRDQPVILIKVESRLRAYRVAAWLARDWDAAPVPFDHVSLGQDYQADELAAVVGSLIESALPKFSSPTAKIRVDLMLPNALLNVPIEKWVLNPTGKHARRLGKYYPLALRSLDRWYEPGGDYPHARGRVHDAWRVLQEPLAHTDMRWFEDGAGANAFDVMTEQNAVFVGLTAGGDDLIEDLLLAGTAIALWFRDPPADGVAARRELGRLLIGQPVSELPTQLKIKRTGAAVPFDWNELALLYDDPHVRPTDIGFDQAQQSPSRLPPA